MADPTIGAELASPQRNFGMRGLLRLALWGMASTGAIVLAVHAGSTETGRERVRLAIAQIQGADNPSGASSSNSPRDGMEERQLAETVRVLAADRERLMTRIAALEQSIDDITGSIARVEKAAQAAQPPQEFAAASTEGKPTHATVAPREDITSSVFAPASAPRHGPAESEAQPPASSTAIKTEYGVDIGGANSFEGLRALWAESQRLHSAQLARLRPISHRRERARSGGTALRLIAGPVANAAMADKLCAAIAAAGTTCQPVPFEGQRLALR